MSTAVARLGSATFHKKSGKKVGKKSRDKKWVRKKKKSGKKTEREQNFRGDLNLEVWFMKE